MLVSQLSTKNGNDVKDNLMMHKTKEYRVSKKRFIRNMDVNGQYWFTVKEQRNIGLSREKWKVRYPPAPPKRPAMTTQMVE
jgi:hypothetical protein